MRLCTNCKRYPVFGSDKITGLGYCKSCQHKRTDRDRRTPLQRALAKAELETDKPVKELRFPARMVSSEEMSGVDELQGWFEDRKRELKGVCQNCGGKTIKDENDKYWKSYIAHLLPKAHVMSVATHPDNWLELCHFGNNCHGMMDKHQIDLIDMNCFDTIIQKFAKIYPHIAPSEKRRIPPILIEYLKTEL